MHVAHANRAQLLADLQCPIQEPSRRVELPSRLEQLAQVVAADHLPDPGPERGSELVALPQRLDGAGLVAGRAAGVPQLPHAVGLAPRARVPRRELAGGRGACEGGRRISVDGVALRTDAVQHGEDERRFVGVGGGDDLDPGIDELGGGGPVVGVLGEEEGFAEEARRPQLGRWVRCCLAASLEPDAALAHPALGPPEEVEVRRQRQHRLGIDREQAVQRDACVVLDAPEHLEMRSFGAGLRGFGLTQPDLQVEAGVAIADQVELTGQGELFRRVLTNRLEQLVQARVGLFRSSDFSTRRAVRSAIFADVWPSLAQTALIAARSKPPANTAIRRSRRRSSSVSKASLHSTVARSDPLRTVGPPDRLREEVEQVVEVPRDVLQVESDHPRRGELDRERKTVDAAADLPDELDRPIAVERSLGTGAGSLLEQADRVGLRQRCEPVVHLVDDPQRLAARREDVEPREAGGEILDELGHSRHDVLAVVEHQEDIAIGQPAGERFLVRLTARPLHADLRGDLAGDEVR